MESFKSILETCLLEQRLVVYQIYPANPEGPSVGIPIWTDGEWIAFDRIENDGSQADIELVEFQVIDRLVVDGLYCRLMSEAHKERPLREIKEKTLAEVLRRCVDSEESISVIETRDRVSRFSIVRDFSEELLKLEEYNDHLWPTGTQITEFRSVLCLRLGGPYAEFFAKVRSRGLV